MCRHSLSAFARLAFGSAWGCLFVHDLSPGTVSGYSNAPGGFCDAFLVECRAEAPERPTPTRHFARSIPFAEAD
jgi:hypothetical protein